MDEDKPSRERLFYNVTLQYRKRYPIATSPPTDNFGLPTPEVDITNVRPVRLPKRVKTETAIMHNDIPEYLTHVVEAFIQDCGLEAIECHPPSWLEFDNKVLVRLSATESWYQPPPSCWLFLLPVPLEKQERVWVNTRECSWQEGVAKVRRELISLGQAAAERDSAIRDAIFQELEHSVLLKDEREIVQEIVAEAFAKHGKLQWRG